MDRDTARETAFAAWMQGAQPRLLRTAYLLCGDPHTAEDLTQTALAKIYLAWHRLHDRDDLGGYARRVLVNEHVSLWRRARRHREVVTDSPPEQAGEDRHYDGAEEALWERLSVLGRKQRAVVVLRFYEQLSVAEVARVLGVSEGTVKSQCSRALATLRGELATAGTWTQEESWTR
ncbi:SigE family RNA polymerase sigma factor [Nocardioides mangrovicus]|uniref:SigE family RNA polymerase sigma factor n=1 Tax=Nocardioides mangrovicus TaxID=2478913 RepID=UPI001E4D18D7|nr:SigE family RNA polymerase sigma factor [Nocardioides mangrovicus]